MKRGFLLFAMVAAAIGVMTATVGGVSATSAPAPVVVQRTTTTVPEAVFTQDDSPTDDPVAVETTMAPAPTEAPTAEVAPATEVATPVKEDPAAVRLRWIIYGLVGLAAVVLVGTILFWRATRPSLLAAPGAPLPAAPLPVAPLPTTAPPIAPAPVTPGVSGATAARGFDAPERIAGPIPVSFSPDPVAFSPGAAGSTIGVAGGALLASISSGPSSASEAFDAIPPPAGEPVFDVPPPRAGGPASASASAGAGAAAQAPAPIEVSASERPPEPQLPPATAALFSALAAIPDKDPTPVRFDDPPVQVVQRRPPPADAPGFDRIAKENTARQKAIAAQRDDDAPRPSGLRPPGEPATERRSFPEELPPVGEFYDQDLDAGDASGRN